jgi:nucleoside-diphosphate-sugar epimerase
MAFHVIVGAGSPGAATAQLLAEDGEDVRLVTRSGRGPDHERIEKIALDATDADALAKVTDGAATLFNCAMPAYDSWPELWPSLADAMLAAAERTGVVYVTLGNTYPYGPIGAEPVTEDQPIAPTTIKGEVRAKMWLDALAAHEAGRVRTVEVRPNDFLGAHAFSIFTILIVPAVLGDQPAAVPADLDAPHTWSHNVDVARTLIAASRDEGAYGRAWHVPSNEPVSFRDLTNRFAEIAGVATPQLSRMSPQDFHAAAKENPIVAELTEMSYLFQRPFVLDTSAAQARFGIEPTPLDESLRLTAESFATAAA